MAPYKKSIHHRTRVMHKAAVAKNTVTVQPLKHLPDELWLQIFSNLSAKEKFAVQRVSKQFKRVLESSTLWQDFCFDAKDYDHTLGTEAHTETYMHGLIEGQRQALQYGESQLRCVWINISGWLLNSSFYTLFGDIFLCCPSIAHMHIHGPFGKIVRRGVGNLSQLEHLEVIEKGEPHFLYPDDGHVLVLPPSLKKLSVEHTIEPKEHGCWLISGRIEELTMRSGGFLNPLNLLPFAETLTSLNLRGYRLTRRTQFEFSTHPFSLRMLAALRHLTLMACLIEDFGPLPDNLVSLHVHASLQTPSCSLAWSRSVLPRLKEISLSYYNSYMQMYLPLESGHEMQSINVEVLSQTLAVQPQSITNQNHGSLESSRHDSQLETLIIRNISIYSWHRLPPLSMNTHLSSIFRDNCQELTTLDLAYALVTAPLLRDIAMCCPALTTVTFEGADNILAMHIEEFIRSVSVRLRRLNLYGMLCYEKSTCFFNAVEARSSLIDLCRALDIELEIKERRDQIASDQDIMQEHVRR